MKKSKRVWHIRPVILVLLALSVLLSLVTLYLKEYTIFYIEVAAVLLAAGYVVISIRSNHKDIYAFLTKTAAALDLTQKKGMVDFPLPALVVNELGEIVLYNSRFREEILDAGDIYGKMFNRIFSGLDPGASCVPQGVEASYKGRRYSVFGMKSEVRDRQMVVMIFLDDTELKNVRDEFFATRPSVLLIVIDNYDELFQNSRESERTHIAGEIEGIFETFTAENEGILRRLNRDRYIMIIEEQYMAKIIEGRFALLDKIRGIVTSERLGATLSIGVGRGTKTFPEADHMARQALEMALGRGGDQAAVKTPSGFDFYGGVSKGVEKRTKVKSRIIASAMAEIIQNCDNCIVMGHRMADLDCFGSGVGLAAAVRRMGKPAVLAIDKRSNLVGDLMRRMEDNGYGDMFVDPDRALEMITRKTLLMITDTHVPHMLESKELYEQCPTVVVIDHHRRMVGHIDNAVIFFHEPYASSASEMVTELLQYFDNGGAVAPLEAEALLAGITLDTKNFVLKTGVRTFEAAAFLRKNGADTLEVKRLFSSSIEAYQTKTKIVSDARVYKKCAIAVTNLEGSDMRIIAPQSADELLSISGVNASFVLYKNRNMVQISARSMGEINVQLIMEKLGGGGHLTMAGAAVEQTLEDAVRNLMEAVDTYLSEKGGVQDTV